MPKDNPNTFKKGTNVAYSIKFLKNAGMEGKGEIYHARGKIIDFVEMGETKLAQIDWGENSNLPKLVNVENLTDTRLAYYD